MKNRMGFYITVLLIAIFTTLIILLLTRLISIENALPLGISIIALIFSIISSFKDELFPFRLLTFIDSLTLVATEPMNKSPNKTIQVLLPITFYNRGYSEGVIQNIKLIVKVENELTQFVFLPIIEIDMAAFMQQHKGINASNSLNVFAGFLLGGKRGVKKDIVFTPRIEDQTVTFGWKPNTYHFELFVQIYGDEKYKKYATLNRKIGINSLTMLATGLTKALTIYPD